MSLTADRLLYTVDELAAAVGLSETTIRDCIAGRSAAYPPLKAKRTKRKGSTGPGRIYVTREQAEQWLASFPDA